MSYFKKNTHSLFTIAGIILGTIIGVVLVKKTESQDFTNQVEVIPEVEQ